MNFKIGDVVVIKKYFNTERYSSFYHEKPMKIISLDTGSCPICRVDYKFFGTDNTISSFYLELYKNRRIEKLNRILK